MDAVGYLNMAIGVVGIVVSILTAPSMVEALSRATRAGADDELAKLGRGVRLFGAILVLATFVFVLVLGVAITLRSVMVALGSLAPGAASALLAAGLVSSSLTIALKLARSWYWVPGIVGTIGLGLATLTAGVGGIGAGFIGVVLFFVPAFLISGAIALASDAEGNRPKS